MVKEKKLLDLFPNTKPIIGMIHLYGYDDFEQLNLAMREINIYKQYGVDAVLIENYSYYSDAKTVEYVLDYLCSYHPNIVYGVNILGDYKKAFELASKYNAKFIQIDSVAGHLPFKEDKNFATELKNLRSSVDSFLLGGVRFKYQPVLSGLSLEEDLSNGMKRCDAIVVTGEATGISTDLEKIKEFRKIIGTKPLIVGAGLNYNNCLEQLEIADGGIVGSYFKEGHIDSGEVSPANVERFMNKVKILRNKNR